MATYKKVAIALYFQDNEKSAYYSQRIDMIGLGWFGALSTLSKVGVVSAAVVTTGFTGSALTNDSDTTEKPPTPDCVASISYSTEKEPVKFNKITKNDASLDKDRAVVEKKGVDGEKTITWKTIYYSPVNCKPSERILDKEDVTKAAKDELILIGTKEPPPPPPPVPKPKPSNCDPNYIPCIPNVSYDLDCPDIGFTVRVVGYDKHKLDRDGDGYGCESY